MQKVGRDFDVVALMLMEEGRRSLDDNMKVFPIRLDPCHFVDRSSCEILFYLVPGLHKGIFVLAGSKCLDYWSKGRQEQGIAKQLII